MNCKRFVGLFLYFFYLLTLQREKGRGSGEKREGEKGEEHGFAVPPTLALTGCPPQAPRLGPNPHPWHIQITLQLPAPTARLHRLIFKGLANFF